MSPGGFGLEASGREGFATIGTKEVFVNDVRKGQIALLYLKNQLHRNGVRLTPDLRRRIANEAKEIGISTDEAMQFLEGITRELVDVAFSK